MTNPTEPVFSLDDLEWRLRELLRDIEAAEAAEAEALAKVRPEHAESARNLVHYIAARRHDLRPLQRSLSAYGLSSLGRMESMVRSWLLTVIASVVALRSWEPRREIWGPLEQGTALLRHNRAELLGEVHGADRATSIMVTMPSEAASDDRLVADLTAAGMDIARVNCAHDAESAWADMISKVRSQPGQLRVAMDLAGPKLRTGPLEPGPQVLRSSPDRDDSGVVVEPARVRFVAAESAEMLEPSHPNEPAVPVVTRSFGSVVAGDELRFADARGRQRRFVAVRTSDDEIVAECDRTTYFRTGLPLCSASGELGPIGELPEVDQFLEVHVGDEVRLQRDMVPQPATHESPHRIGCSLPEAFQDARPGEPIRFDDGKIEGLIREVTPDEIVVEVTRAGIRSAKLRAEKGINLPETDLRLSALTAEDRAHLPFVAAHADLVNLSFVRSAADVADLIHELERLDATHVGIVLKIETRRAFEHLPQMLLEAMRWPRVGVMIARGDLAVEVGFDRLAEVQEEMLWICEAAHVPVIWATEVLNSLAKKGLASRAEVTDAAMSRRAEGVMLNKGPYIVDAVVALDNILGRMGGHVSKKRALLRPLASFSLDDR